MDVRGLRISGSTGPAQSKVGGICLAAMEELDYRSRDLPVQIRHDPAGRPGVEASTSVAGIIVSPDLLADELRLCWILSEEVAHRYLNEVFGIPHGGDFLDRFAQEGFASWSQCQRMLRPGLFSPDEMISTPITEHTATPGLGHDLGKHGGSARGGSYKGAERLQEWYESPLGDQDLKRRVRQTLEQIPAGGSAAEFARRVADAHAAAREGGC